MKYSPKRKGASNRLRKGNEPWIFGDTILCPNCWTVREALSESILDNSVVSQKLRNGILKGRVDSRVRGQAIGVQTQMRSFNFFFGIKMGVIVIQTTHPLLYNTHIFMDVAGNNGLGRAGSNQDPFCIVSTNVA